MAQKKAAEQQKRRDEYWAEHASEKAALESELAQLERQAAALEEEIAAIPGEEEKSAVQRRINELTREKNALGSSRAGRRPQLRTRSPPPTPRYRRFPTAWTPSRRR